MPKKRKRESLSDNCRVCLYNDDDNMADIFSSDLHPKIKELAESAAINIEDEDYGLPRNICHVCLYKLEMWCDFRAQFIKTNSMLHQLLENSQLSDFMVLPSKKKIDDSQLSQDDPHEMKKSKADTSISIANTTLDNDCESQESRVFGENSKADLGTTSESQPLQKLSPTTKNRQLGMRRTTEQRLASTQRWEARKKALLAATGETDTDSDSILSDDTQLSPIQKARAKNVGQKNDSDWQRLSNKAVNNLTSTQPGLFSINSNENFQSNEIPENEINEVLKPPEINFHQQTVQSELTIDDSTYVVTSVLVVENSPIIEEPTLNNLPNANKSDDSNQDRRTDIFDAVQLRRVKPVVLSISNDKIPSKRILNAEIEGTDVESLRRVQKQIANFMDTDMKSKILNNVVTEEKEEPETIQNLEHKMRVIIETSLKEDHNQKPKVKTPPNNRLNKSFSVAFIKAAMKSQVFQPTVLLNRIEPDEVNSSIDSYSENAFDNTETNDIFENSNNTHNLQDDNNCSEIFTFENEIHHVEIVDGHSLPSKNLISPKKKSLAKIETESNKKNIDLKKSNEKNIEVNRINEKNIEINESDEKNIVMAEIHDNNQQEVRKRMRCKKCSEVVSVKFVKTHVCRTINMFKCNFCDAQFKSVNMLDRHLRTHENQVKIERVENIAQTIIEKEKITAVSSTVSSIKNTFQCFICDKPFESEEILENHLQEHRNMPEEEPTKKKELFQCAICGDSLDSAETLGKHVEKHLYDESDDNHTSVDASKKDNINKVEPEIEIHACDICSKEFDTSLDLLLHVQIHEEDLAIAEWEKQLKEKPKSHICTICEETFDTENELADHSNSHNDDIHECQVCETSFVSLPELQEHINTHFA